jgi:hypothetical protein
MEYRINKTQFMNTRSMVIALVVVGAVTGGNLWIHRGDPAIGFNRYDNFGVSFDYDAWTNIQEGDFGGGQPTEDGGSVTASVQSNEALKQYGVFWMKPEFMPPFYSGSPEGALDFLLGSAGLAGTQIVDRGEYSTTTKDGHEVVYQTFGISESGITIPAVIGAWYNEEQGRYLLFYLAHIPDFENIEAPNEGLVETWADVLGSIKFVEIQDKME